MHQLHWGKTKQNQSYIKDRPHKLFGVKGSLIVKGGKQILNFKNPHGFKASHGLKVELKGIHEHDPKTKTFTTTIREVWNSEPSSVRENVNKIILSSSNPNQLASFNTDTRTAEFCMPEGLKINEYGQIVRHELDDADKANQKKKHEILKEEYIHEFFAETGQYLYQKDHGMEHYNLTNPKAMTLAIKLYHSITGNRK